MAMSANNVPNATRTTQMTTDAAVTFPRAFLCPPVPGMVSGSDSFRAPSVDLSTQHLPIDTNRRDGESPGWKGESSTLKLSRTKAHSDLYIVGNCSVDAVAPKVPRSSRENPDFTCDFGR